MDYLLVLLIRGRTRLFQIWGITQFSEPEFPMIKRILIKRKKIKEFLCAVILPTDEDQFWGRYCIMG